MRLFLLAELAGFQVVWWACALGAAHGHSAPGIIAAGVFIALLLVLRRGSAQTWLPIIAAGVVGLVAESLLVAHGHVRYAAAWPSEHWAPAWIVALWMSFGATVATMRRLLARHTYPSAALLGTIVGPLTYWAGANVGALRLADAAAASLLATALVWGIAMPLLLLAHAYADGTAHDRSA